MTVPVGMSNKDICLMAVNYAIKKYIREGETEIGLLNAWKGNQIKLVQFLRTREFGGEFKRYEGELRAESDRVWLMPETEEKGVKTVEISAPVAEYKPKKNVKPVKEQAKVVRKQVKTVKKEEKRPKEGDLSSLFD